MSNKDPWNKCNRCGRFIAYKDFENGATRFMLTPDSAYSVEDFETLCIKCAKQEAHDEGRACPSVLNNGAGTQNSS